jgi:hypothetical protein
LAGFSLQHSDMLTTFRAIAAALNDRAVRTARGGARHDSTVRNLLARAP